MSTSRTYTLPTVLLLAVVVGVGLGALAVVGDRQGVPRALTLLSNLAAPWGLAAFGVGRGAASPLQGAIGGGVALVVGMAAFYVFTPALYLHGARDVVWTGIALVIGPLMGFCGGVWAREDGDSPRVVSVVPAGVLLGEGLWVATERRAWRWDLGLEPHRWSDVAVLVLLAVLALVIPLLVGGRSGLLRTYLFVATVGVASAVAMSCLMWVLVRV